MEYTVLQVGAAETLSTVVTDEMRGLWGRGWRSEVACWPDRWAPALQEAGFTVHPIRLRHHGGVPAALLGFIDLWRLMSTRRYTLVHTHNAEHGVLARLAARLIGIPAVHTWHSNPVVAMPEGLGRWLAVAVERVAAEFGAGVLFPTVENLNMAVESRAVPPERAIYIGSGIPYEQFAASRRSRAGVRKELGLGATDFVVLSVARLHPVKGHEYLIEALRAISTHVGFVKLVLAGTGPIEDRLRALVRARGVADKVVFLGHRIDVVDLLHASDICCLASRHEGGAPRALLEAHAARVATVGTDVPGIREAIRHEETGVLVSPTNPEAMASAWLRLMVDPRLARELSDHAWATLVRDGHEDAVVARVAEAYKRAVDGDRRNSYGSRLPTNVWSRARLRPSARGDDK